MRFSRRQRRRGRRIEDEHPSLSTPVTPEVITAERRQRFQELVRETPVSRIVAARDAALDEAARAVASIAQGYAHGTEAHKLGKLATGGTVFPWQEDQSNRASYQRVSQRFNPEATLEGFRQHLDATVWVHLYRVSGMDNLMDKAAWDKVVATLSDDVPDVTEEAVFERLSELRDNSVAIFQRGLAAAFAALDRRFKSHDGFKVGARVIVPNVFNSWGQTDMHGRTAHTVADVERAFAVLDGKPQDVGSLLEEIRNSRGSGISPRTSTVITPYFKVRTYKNGNVHLWMIRKDLVNKVNRTLADYYGKVVPDGVARSGARYEEKDLRSRSGVPSKDLAFYRSPPPVVRALIDYRAVGVIQPHERVLEPSAGTGDIVRGLLALKGGFRIDAIEIDGGRVGALEKIRSPNLKVHKGNFLRTVPKPTYNYVFMNPPFYGTHWMEHVVHAYDFLAPRGTLRAVLPVTAELGETKKHKAFRRWAEARSAGYGTKRVHFRDLPQESFAASGTKINTVILTLHA